jgi:release factor glutamine methyltransferase
MAQHVAEVDAAGLQRALDEPVAAVAAARFRELVARRAGGEPLQYVLGRWAFRSLDLTVDRRVLIPRPETEVLAELALAEGDRLGARRVVDLGTGTGAVALALAVERPDLAVWATDASAEALEVARANLAAVAAERPEADLAARVQLGAGEWFAALPSDLRGRLDVVVSNPPYVAEDEMAELPAEVHDWEPALALVAGDDGLRDIRTILAEAPTWLARPGAVLLEMAPHQVGRAERLARSAGFTATAVLPDLTGRDRILRARI